MNDRGIARVAEYGDRYRAEKIYDEDEPGRDEGPFGLTFFLKRAFASARSEGLSGRYREAAEKAIKCHKNGIKNCFESDASVRTLGLRDDLEDAGVGNKRDRRMVVDILDHLEDFPDYEVVGYVKTKVDENDLEGASDKLREIYNIGPKKATLFLRDAVVLLDCEDDVAPGDYEYLFPVDTWVHGVANELGVVDTDGVDWSQNSPEIIDELPAGVSPIEFNQGAWYVGANAFDVLIENLTRVEPD